ncbi:uncharacterized protein PRCAT00006153001 [Priceomyces carsonii]|uniref:uncharacterized protein n=1 Tax=Priceomyces carsonii TaxID=28549 RepID=UPI002EDB7EF9|nr:unnamed protein product [Priceomyces carsonii]
MRRITDFPLNRDSLIIEAMYTLKYYYKNFNIRSFPFILIFCFLEFKSYAIALYVLFVIEITYYTLLYKSSSQVMEKELVMNVIDKRPFRFADESEKGLLIWDEIIQDTVIHVEKRLGIQEYEMGDVEYVKDIFISIINEFCSSFEKKESKEAEDLSNWEKTLVVARNIYEQDVTN